MFLYMLYVFSSIAFLVSVFTSYKYEIVKRKTAALEEFYYSYSQILSDKSIADDEKKHLSRLVIVAFDEEKAFSYLMFCSSKIGSADRRSSKSQKVKEFSPESIQKMVNFYMAGIEAAGACCGRSYQARRIRKRISDGGIMKQESGMGTAHNFIMKLPRTSKLRNLANNLGHA